MPKNVALLSACLALWCAAACGREQGVTEPTAPNTPASEPLRASGTVVEVDGGPVEGAAVDAFGCLGPYSNPLSQTLTDAEGRFGLVVENVAAGRCMALKVQKAGYVSAEVRGTLVGVTVRLQRLRRVSGTIVEVDGGPVDRVTVSSAGFPLPTTLSDATGAFVMDGVALSMHFDKGGFVPRSVVVPPGQNIHLGTVNFQRRLAVQAGSRLTSRLSAADVPYDTYPMWDEGVWCVPCKRIDIDSGQKELVATVQWSGPVRLHLWATDFFSDVVASAQPGESALTLRLPPDRPILLIGIRSSTLSPEPLHEPVNFELSISEP